MNKPARDQDEKLGNLLRQSRRDAPLPAGFREDVWRKIERPAAGFAFGNYIANWVTAVLQRPALATAYLALLLALGVTAGWTRGHRENARVRNALGELYVRSLDPYAMPHP